MSFPHRPDVLSNISMKYCLQQRIIFILRFRQLEQGRQYNFPIRVYRAKQAQPVHQEGSMEKAIPSNFSAEWFDPSLPAKTDPLFFTWQCDRALVIKAGS
jgi:hypothetical protein